MVQYICTTIGVGHKVIVSTVYRVVVRSGTDVLIKVGIL